VNSNYHIVYFVSLKKTLDNLQKFKNNKIKPILYIRYNLINGFGDSWLLELINIFNKKFAPKDFKILVDIKKNYGLFFSIIEQNIDFIKIEGDGEILKKLKEIALSNKVLINPNFSIVKLPTNKKLLSLH